MYSITFTSYNSHQLGRIEALPTILSDQFLLWPFYQEVSCFSHSTWTVPASTIQLNSSCPNHSIEQFKPQPSIRTIATQTITLERFLSLPFRWTIPAPNHSTNPFLPKPPIRTVPSPAIPPNSSCSNHYIRTASAPTILPELLLLQPLYQEISCSGHLTSTVPAPTILSQQLFSQLFCQMSSCSS